MNSIAHVLIPHRNTRGIHTIILAGGEVSDIWIRSKRHDAVNQMPSLVEDPLCHTDVLKEQQRFWKRILIVDDDNDITTTFKAAIEDSNNGNDVNKRIEVNTSNDPVLALLEFTPNFYDLLLVDINMPHMDVCEKILAIDINVKVCFMSCAAEVNQGLREIYPISLGCFIRKPVSIDYLLKRIRSELD